MLKLIFFCSCSKPKKFVYDLNKLFETVIYQYSTIPPTSADMTVSNTALYAIEVTGLKCILFRNQEVFELVFKTAPVFLHY